MTTGVQTSSYDYANRGRRLVLPRDPDFGGGTGPEVSGELHLDPRGLPIAARAFVGGDTLQVLSSVDYDVRGQVLSRTWGSATSPVLEESFSYDVRSRPIEHIATRSATAGALPSTIGYVTQLVDEDLVWDEASNLIGLVDNRATSEWRGRRIRPRSQYRKVSRVAERT